MDWFLYDRDLRHERVSQKSFDDPAQDIALNEDVTSFKEVGKDVTSSDYKGQASSADSESDYEDVCTQKI